MSRRRTTFGKLQRDRDKQARARAKQERRAERAEQGDDTDGPEVPASEADQAEVLAKLADLHAAFDDGKIGFDDFEARREPAARRLSGAVRAGGPRPPAAIPSSLSTRRRSGLTRARAGPAGCAGR